MMYSSWQSVVLLLAIQLFGSLVMSLYYQIPTPGAVLLSSVIAFMISVVYDEFYQKYNTELTRAEIEVLYLDEDPPPQKRRKRKGKKSKKPKLRTK